MVRSSSRERVSGLPASQVLAVADGAQTTAPYACVRRLLPRAQDAQAVGQPVEGGEEPGELGGVVALLEPPQHGGRHPVGCTCSQLR